MREPIRDKGRLEHMAAAIDRILEFMKDKSYKIDENEVKYVIEDDLCPLRIQIANYLTETNWEQWEQK